MSLIQLSTQKCFPNSVARFHIANLRRIFSYVLWVFIGVAITQSSIGDALRNDSDNAENLVCTVPNSNPIADREQVYESTEPISVRTHFQALVIYYNPRVVDNDGVLKPVTAVL